MSANASRFRTPYELTACRTPFRTPGGSALSAQELEGLTGWIDGVRAEFGLPPKEGKLSSNFILPTKWQEIAHILRVEFDDMFNELCETGSEPVPDFRRSDAARIPNRGFRELVQA